jgi:hypothetical protein
MPSALSTTANVKERKGTQLRLPIGEPDLHALMTVIGDWVVPLLVTEFLAEYSASAVVTDANGNQRTTKTRTREK